MHTGVNTGRQVSFIAALLINPRHMREDYGSHCVCLCGYLCVCVCVCVCVCYHASCYIPRLYIENKVLLGFLWRFQDMDSLKMLCSKVLATFADQLCLLRFLMDKRDSNGFFSRRLACK